MKTIETEVAVGIDGTAVIQFQLAADIAPGLHRAVVVLEETTTVDGTSEVGRSLQSPYGLWANLGVDLAATEIAELRRDTWSSFPRKDI